MNIKFKQVYTIVYTILYTICFCSLAGAQENLQKLRINRWDGGMVSSELADILQPNQCASMVNVVIDKLGQVSKRGGQDLFVEDEGSIPFRGIGRFDPDIATSYLVAASGTNVIRAEASSTDWTLASPVTANLTAGQDTEFIQANDYLFVINGYDRTGWYDGARYIGSGSYPSSPPTATTGAWLRNYLFLAGATTNEDWLYISNNLDPTKFDASDVVKINTGDGQKIQHLEAFRLNELIIYKQRSIFVLDIAGSTLADWTIQPISTSVGTIAPRSVVSLGNDQWFLSSEPIAVRSLVRSSFDKILLEIVSAPIQDIFDGTNGEFDINRTYIQKAAAVLFDNKYILAVPTGTSTVNNTVLVYDFTVKAWYIIKGWYPADWVVFDKKLYMMDAYDGRIVQVFADTRADYVLGGSGAIEAASYPSVAIEWVVQTKNIDFDNPENYKILDAIETEWGATGDYYANVWISLDDSDWASVYSVNLKGDSRVLPAELPTALNTAGVARRTWQTQSYGEWKKMKVMFRNNASDQSVELQRATLFGVPRQWRRE